ncbi:MAG: hypothetical protein R2855_06300 [Thermomicrobiales bacterium]
MKQPRYLGCPGRNPGWKKRKPALTAAEEAEMAAAATEVAQTYIDDLLV